MKKKIIYMEKIKMIKIDEKNFVVKKNQIIEMKFYKY